MKSFTVRIELKNADSINDYNNLHSEMQKQGFSRSIFSSDGIEYKLPNAEYNIAGSFDRATVMEKAKKVISTIGRTGAILITESNGRSWNNLDKVKP